ncbi:hypothetical protein BDV96DRAFT_279089 [Lophiotrema nucula]|uniref:Uncharacterized protein n=1 Tax=Lophiotrema nucula TaxID=690887 RepID=A0A6A5ZPD4_9PLEO|nr:hypothetical protein BDV96DRAFT_279089 [Lophiotrema nucula]
MPVNLPHPNKVHGITIDPQAPGTNFRIALAVESALNIGFAAYILIDPTTALKFLAADTSLINPLAKSVISLMGISTFIITVPMLISIQNTRRGIESRVPTYYLLGAGELLFIALFTYLGIKGEKETGISSKALVSATGNLLPPLAWRVFVLGFKPLWVGRYVDGEKKA